MKKKPSLSPQKIRGNENAWYYEDATGITVVSEARDANGKYLGVTMQTRLLWKQIMKSASRCGITPEQPTP